MVRHLVSYQNDDVPILLFLYRVNYLEVYSFMQSGSYALYGNGKLTSDRNKTISFDKSISELSYYLLCSIKL